MEREEIYSKIDEFIKYFDESNIHGYKFNGILAEATFDYIGEFIYTPFLQNSSEVNTHTYTRFISGLKHPGTGTKQDSCANLIELYDHFTEEHHDNNDINAKYLLADIAAARLAMMGVMGKRAMAEYGVSGWNETLRFLYQLIDEEAYPGSCGDAFFIVGMAARSLGEEYRL